MLGLTPTNLSILFFSGIIKEECQIPVTNELGVQEVYKTGEKRGQLKTKKGIREVKIKGFGLKSRADWETKKVGIYSTNEAVLKVIAKKEDHPAGELATIMLQIREKEKLLGTYYTGYEKLIYPDSCVHPSFQHVVTDTGRLSSNKPNVQQIP